jgi:hypothetical protein
MATSKNLAENDFSPAAITSTKPASLSIAIAALYFQGDQSTEPLTGDIPEIEICHPRSIAC